MWKGRKYTKRDRYRPIFNNKPCGLADYKDLEGEDDGDVDGGHDEHRKDPRRAFEDAAEDEDGVVGRDVCVVRRQAVDAVGTIAEHAHLKSLAASKYWVAVETDWPMYVLATPTT